MAIVRIGDGDSAVTASRAGERNADRRGDAGARRPWTIITAPIWPGHRPADGACHHSSSAVVAGALGLRSADLGCMPLRLQPCVGAAAGATSASSASRSSRSPFEAASDCRDDARRRSIARRVRPPSAMPTSCWWPRGDRRRRRARSPPSSSPRPRPRAVLQRADVVAQFNRSGFTYFRQISVVLSTITLRLRVPADRDAADRIGEPAARRDRRAARARLLAAPRRRDAAVGIGAARRRRRRARAAARRWRSSRVPRPHPAANARAFPSSVHFFVFEPRALVHPSRRCSPRRRSPAAAYPMWLAARLPIAATLAARWSS